MKKLLLLGDEAFAQGALDAGLSGAFGYPGTPSTEILEYIQRNQEAKDRNVHRSWSANEKTAFEEALGMSYTGKRAIVTMKHVGLNVAADPFINSGITGTNGGIIIAVADDPSMHSSQNEQDSRFYGKFAMLPTLEPSNQQEAYEMPKYAFEISEKYKLPVLLNLTTRLAHSRSVVVRDKVLKENILHLPEDPKQFMLLPAFARKNYERLLSHQKKLLKESENSKYNQYYEGHNTEMGIIASGIAYNYLMENYVNNQCPYPVLKISQYPLPPKLIKRLTSECKDILVLEEGMPFIEEILQGHVELHVKIHGHLDGTIPRTGELNPTIVRKALNLESPSTIKIPDVVVGRPPELCQGCPHRDTYYALNGALENYEKGHVFSDIGCYTLGFLPPFNSINTCVCMGASVSMAVGAAEAGFYPSIGVIGDSTFGHSGMTGLLDAINKNSNVVIFILDNGTTAMTGMQESSVTGKLEDICLGLGVAKEHIKIIKPLKSKLENNIKIIKEEIEFMGVSVIIPRRPCIHLVKKKKKKQK